MTINSTIATVADSISNLSISGITIKDIDTIPDSASMLCPLLIPQPNGFVTDVKVESLTYGSGGTANMNTSYTLNYVYLHCEAGSGINAYAPYAGIITKLELIIESILTNDNVTGAVDMKLGNIGNIGVIQDPSGNQFWGLMFSLRVLEYTQ